MRDVVAASLHTSAMYQVGTATGDNVAAAAHVHGNADHAVRGDATTGRGHHRSDMSAASLRVKIVSSTVLPVQLSLRVVGVGRPAGDTSWELVYLNH